MRNDKEVEIPFFVYDKYSREACFILLKNTSEQKMDAIKLVASTRISS